MLALSQLEDQIHFVSNFQDLVALNFQGEMNAACWKRELIGDFAEVTNKLSLSGNMSTIEVDELMELQLSKQGQLARDILLNDLQLLETHGAAPVLNVIKCYDRDDSCSFFPTDVYSFHVDRSALPADTFLCTYHGDSSQILPNSQAIQKVLVPEIRQALKALYQGKEEGFELFLEENFFDLHYQAKANAQAITLGTGHLWRLAIDHPEAEVPPCIHRAPEEKSGQNRLLLIC
jgi:hypothetical protein